MIKFTKLVAMTSTFALMSGLAIAQTGHSFSDAHGAKGVVEPIISDRSQTEDYTVEDDHRPTSSEFFDGNAILLGQAGGKLHFLNLFGFKHLADEDVYTLEEPVRLYDFESGARAGNKQIETRNIKTVYETPYFRKPQEYMHYTVHSYNPSWKDNPASRSPIPFLSEADNELISEEVISEDFVKEQEQVFRRSYRAAEINKDSSETSYDIGGDEHNSISQQNAVYLGGSFETNFLGKPIRQERWLHGVTGTDLVGDSVDEKGNVILSDRQGNLVLSQKGIKLVNEDIYGENPKYKFIKPHPTKQEEGKLHYILDESYKSENSNGNSEILDVFSPLEKDETFLGTFNNKKIYLRGVRGTDFVEKSNVEKNGVKNWMGQSDADGFAILNPAAEFALTNEIKSQEYKNVELIAEFESKMIFEIKPTQPRHPINDVAQIKTNGKRALIIGILGTDFQDNYAENLAGENGQVILRHKAREILKADVESQSFKYVELVSDNLIETVYRLKPTAPVELDKYVVSNAAETREEHDEVYSEMLGQIVEMESGEIFNVPDDTQERYRNKRSASVDLPYEAIAEGIEEEILFVPEAETEISSVMSESDK